jgi:hypothetical protein
MFARAETDCGRLSHLGANPNLDMSLPQVAAASAVSSPRNQARSLRSLPSGENTPFNNAPAGFTFRGPFNA